MLYRYHWDGVSGIGADIVHMPLAMVSSGSLVSSLVMVSLCDTFHVILIYNSFLG